MSYLSAWNELGAGVAKAEHSSRQFKVPAEKVDEWFVKLGSSLDTVLDKIDEIG